MLAEEAQELYLCALGINDEISLGTSYIGTIEDITNYDSYSDYADTFYGNYGKIIEQIKEHAPKSKIVLMSIAYLYNATEDSFTAAIKNIADYYNIPFINIKDDAFYAKDSIYKTGQSYNHPTDLYMQVWHKQMQDFSINALKIIMNILRTLQESKISSRF